MGGVRRFIGGRLPRLALGLALLLVGLLALDALLYQVALPVALDLRGGAATLTIDGQALSLGDVGQPFALQFPARDPLVHEYQIDGTDSANNFTLDTSYLSRIAPSPYYRFQAWMRDLNGTSRWRDLRVIGDGRVDTAVAWPGAGLVALSSVATVHIGVRLQRPETPVSFELVTAANSVYAITIDRNNRRVTAQRYVNGVADQQPVVSTFFPTQPGPFAAMVLDFIVRVLFWATLLTLAVLVVEAAIGVVGARATGADLTPQPPLPRGEGEPEMSSPPNPLSLRGEGEPEPGPEVASLAPLPSAGGRGERDEAAQVAGGEDSPRSEIIPTAARFIRTVVTATYHQLARSLHPVALAALPLSLIFVSWIALVQFHAEPHIYDASAYLFSAKTFAGGHLWVPTPAAADRFPGAFMLDVMGKRFTQYPPGTGMTLAVGVLLGMPWLVEPLLGTLALLGIGLIAARLYDRRVATIAVLLGGLSPFYSYLAASYLSHAVALFFLVWGFWLLLRFAQGGAGWNLPLAVAFFGMGQLTRDQVGLAFAVIAAAIVIALCWRPLLALFTGREAGADGQPAARVSSPLDSPRLIAVVAALAVALLFAAANLAYTAALTGKATVSPRLLFNPGDHFGFGPGVGFYGQHTLAAGLVNLDELLSSLAIDLFGWPFYLTLAFIFTPFILRRAILADWLLLAGGVILTGAYIGYFYHGIYLGPRYLFETLPFLLILTARGIVELARLGVWARRPHPLAPSPTGEGEPEPITIASPHGGEPSAAHRVSGATVALMTALLACSLVYFWPRQIALHDNFTGLPAGTHIALDRIYAPGLRHAIIVTGDYTFYEYVLFPLNDPMLRQDVLYALAGDASQYAELRAAYPGRALYQLNIAPDGGVTYTAVAGG